MFRFANFHAFERTLIMLFVSYLKVVELYAHFSNV